MKHRLAGLALALVAAGCSADGTPHTPAVFSPPQLASSWNAAGVADMAVGADHRLYLSRPAAGAVDVILTQSPGAPRGGWVIESLPGKTLQPFQLDANPGGGVTVLVQDRSEIFPHLRAQYVHCYSDQGELLHAWPLNAITDITDLAVDAEHNAYVLEAYPGRVVKYAASGKLLRTWGGEDTPSGAFQLAVKVRIAASGEVLVLDRNARELLAFTPAGAFLRAQALTHPENGFSMEAFGRDEDQRLHVARPRSTTVAVFSRDGAHLLDWGEFRHPIDVEVGSPGAFFVRDDGRISLWTNQ